jgi:hypothetical protein
MKTLTHLTTCFILLFSSQTFSQDSVMSGGGMGGPDMGSVDVDVPDEEGKQAENSNDNANPNAQTTDTTSTSSWFPKSFQSIWNTPIISKVRPVDPVEKFRNRINSQDKVNSGTRPRIANKDWDIPTCPNNGNGTKKDSDQTIDPPFLMPPPYLCDCCCHSKSARDIPLTSSSNGWDQYQDSSNSYTHDERYNDDRRSENGGCKSTSKDNQSEPKGTDDSHAYSDDDCDCNCRCRKPKGFVMFD